MSVFGSCRCVLFTAQLMKVNVLNPFESRAVIQKLLKEMPSARTDGSFGVSLASCRAVGSCRNISCMLL